LKAVLDILQGQIGINPLGKINAVAEIFTRSQHKTLKQQIAGIDIDPALAVFRIFLFEFVRDQLYLRMYPNREDNSSANFSSSCFFFKKIPITNLAGFGSWGMLIIVRPL
jgi:hypothetical protein